MKRGISKGVFELYKGYMRYDSILANGGFKSDFSWLISPLSTMFYTKKDKDFSRFDFSELAKPFITPCAATWTESEISQPIIKCFTREGNHTILVTYSSRL